MRGWWLVPAMVLTGLVWAAATATGAIGGDDGDVRSGIVRGEYRNADPHLGGIEVGPAAPDAVVRIPVGREVWVGPQPTVVIDDPGPISLIATEEQIRAALERAGAEPEWIEPLVRIARCESRYHLDAVGDQGNSLGIFQTWTGWYEWAGEDIDQWQDLDVAARVAVAIRRQRGRFGGRGGWACAGLLGIY